MIVEKDYQFSGDKEVLNYSSIWNRLVAWLIDIVIVFFSIFFIKLIPDGVNAITSLLFYSRPVDEYYINYWVIQITIVVVVFWLYFALMESLSTQGTIGKMIAGIKVVNEEEEKISFANASGRFFLQLVSLCLLGIGHLLALFFKNKQTLYDMLSKCVVIKR
ncbi:RDD family protein [Ornithinibacillus bavariensis]|uniref:RDD domain-containing protein n=1 Tax=Ornithinibacillus bavariensis TaxID=545502 RepID=A0A919X7G0_9BACI|nr:RDD family protein [Ornithinibacillus bavariensis]GIO25852.1 hypothetical protein J43TS3_04630 [Ornithinibacillus bavariensis]